MKFISHVSSSANDTWFKFKGLEDKIAAAEAYA